MNILFISNNQPDYLSDCVFHGLNVINQVNLEYIKTPYYMFKDYSNLSKIYGRGFTIFGKLNNNLKKEFNNDEILNKIIDKYYDKVIYGSIHRNNSYINIIHKYYNKNDIIIMDGEDHPNILFQYTNNSKYFKRELYKNIKNVYPISFSIPSDSIVKNKPNKDKYLSDMIPLPKEKRKMYKFYNEKDYYHEYQRSVFAITHKKAGWDCLRHYEILLNGSIPLFNDINNCPEYTMVNFPKKKIKETNKLYNKVLEYDQYNDYIEYFINYTKENLTTEKVINYILQ